MKRIDPHSLDRYGSDLGRAATQTFANFKTTIDGKHHEALETCLNATEAFAMNLDGWLVIYGKTGNGKSHLAAAARNWIVEVTGKPAIYITAPDMLYMLRRMFNDRIREEEVETFEERLDVYRKAPALMLDDLGAEKLNDWSTETIFSVIDYRYRLRLPTMITTNLDPYSTSSFDSRIRTRITDMELCVVMPNMEPNYRERSVDER